MGLGLGVYESCVIEVLDCTFFIVDVGACEMIRIGFSEMNKHGHVQLLPHTLSCGGINWPYSYYPLWISLV